MSETTIQTAFLREAKLYFERWFPELMIMNDSPFYHIANEGRRPGKTGGILKYKGLRKGVPDLCLPIPVDSYGALYIEFKTPKGVQKPEQLSWEIGLTQCGNKCALCDSVESAMCELRVYMGVNDD